MPCASVSAKRTRTSVEKLKPCMRRRCVAELIAANQPCVVLTGAGIAPRAGSRTSGAPAGIWASTTRYEVASIDGFRRRPGARLGVLRPPPRRARRRRSRTPATGRSPRSSGAARRGGDHAERRPPARAGRLARRRRGARLDRDGELPRLRAVPSAASEVVRCCRVPPAPSCGAVLKPDVVMFGELLPGGGDRAARLRSRARRRAAARRRLVARGLAGRRPARRDARPRRQARDRQPRPTPYDARADVVVHAGAGEVLAAAAAALSS